MFGTALASDDASLADAAHDFGALVRLRPSGVLRAKTVRDVVQAVRAATASGMMIAPRGQGHCTRGQAQVRGGVVIDMRDLSEVRIVDGAAVVGAGARWDAVLREALSRGLAPPVLTDYLGLSVGGTLSVGGIGGQSFCQGLQTDLVQELTVVTGRGEPIACSRESHSLLFDSVRAGLGQCGVIVEARIRLAPAPELAHVYHLPYSSIRSFLEDQEVIAEEGRFDYVLGSALPTAAGGWTFSLEVAKYAATAAPLEAGRLLEGLAFRRGAEQASTVSYPEHAMRLDAMEREMKTNGTWTARHPWVDFLLPASSARDFIEQSLAELDPRLLHGGYVMTYPLTRAVCTTPLVPVHDEPRAFLFDILPNVPSADEERLVAFEEYSRGRLEHARRIGARIYPIGYPLGTSEMRRADWVRQYGPAWDQFSAAKREYDPRGVLTPTPNIFGSI